MLRTFVSCRPARPRDKILPDGDEHMDPNLPVFGRVPEILHVELVGEGASVMFETSRDFISLFRSEEFGRRRVVVHNPKCKNRYTSTYQPATGRSECAIVLPMMKVTMPSRI